MDFIHIQHWRFHSLYISALWIWNTPWALVLQKCVKRWSEIQPKMKLPSLRNSQHCTMRRWNSSVSLLGPSKSYADCSVSHNQLVKKTNNNAENGCLSCIQPGVPNASRLDHIQHDIQLQTRFPYVWHK